MPLAIAACVLARAIVPESADPSTRKLDVRGQLLGATALGALVFGVIALRDGGHVWIVSLAISAAAAVLFLVVEQRIGSHALVPLSLFRGRAFSGAVTATAAMTFGIYGMIFLVPLVWQSSGLLSARGAGLSLLPCALLFFLIAPRSGHLAHRTGVRACTAAGTAVIGCGLLVLGCTHLAKPLGLAWVGLGLTGIGMGINTGPLMSAAVDAVGPERSGTADSIINVARMVGATLGVAVLGAAYVFGGGNEPGFQAATLTGGGVQLAGAVVAWWMIR